MPKNSFLDVMERWRDMDRLLCKGTLNVRRFAKDSGVNPKRVRDDIRAFEKFGQIIVPNYIDVEGLMEKNLKYEDGTTPIFSCNIECMRLRR